MREESRLNSAWLSWRLQPRHLPNGVARNRPASPASPSFNQEERTKQESLYKWLHYAAHGWLHWGAH